jgi:hypothetical protein
MGLWLSALLVAAFAAAGVAVSSTTAGARRLITVAPRSGSVR